MNFTEYLASNIESLRMLDLQELRKFEENLDLLRRDGCKLWVAGNGGSAAAASHAVADFNKTIYSYGGIPLKSISLTEMISLETAISNDLDFSQTISFPLEVLAEVGDAVLLISVSGNSSNIVNAISKAKEMGIKTFAIFGSAGMEVGRRVDFPIIIKSADYQIVENIQLFIIHWIVKALSNVRF